MAKVTIETSTLSSIGSAIRGKEGSSELIPTADMATRITNLPSGGGKLKQVLITTSTGKIDLSPYIAPDDTNFLLFVIARESQNYTYKQGLFSPLFEHKNSYDHPNPETHVWNTASSTAPTNPLPTELCGTRKQDGYFYYNTIQKIIYKNGIVSFQEGVSSTVYTLNRAILIYIGE